MILAVGVGGKSRITLCTYCSCRNGSPLVGCTVSIQKMASICSALAFFTTKGMLRMPVDPWIAAVEITITTVFVMVCPWMAARSTVVGSATTSFRAKPEGRQHA